MGPGEAIGLLIAIGFPSLFLIYLTRRWFALKEKRLEIDAQLAAEKAAQYVSHSKDIEARLAVVEQIVVDRGAETAAQIEALRVPRLTGDKDVQTRQGL